LLAHRFALNASLLKTGCLQLSDGFVCPNLSIFTQDFFLEALLTCHQGKGFPQIYLHIQEDKLQDLILLRLLHIFDLRHLHFMASETASSSKLTYTYWVFFLVYIFPLVTKEPNKQSCYPVENSIWEKKKL